MFTFFESVARNYHYEYKDGDEAGDQPENPEMVRGGATADSSKSSSPENGWGNLPETDEVKSV